ncbi:MAG: hypothetical protein RL095_3892 [Verrucomicrobiota bacterium]|jgi:hypothetical protein
MSLLDQIKRLLGVTEKPPFDPSVFGDPLAQRIDWSPLVQGGTNIRTHQLDFQHSQRLEFRATAAARFCAGIFIVLPATLILAAFVKKNFPWAAAIVGAVLLTIGIALWREFTKPIVFDKARGWYWKSRQEPLGLPRRENLKAACKLDEIRALQILGERCKTKNSSFYSYELNLVLSDGSRLGVVDHGRLEELRTDAQHLAEFLGVPIWEKPDL